MREIASRGTRWRSTGHRRGSRAAHRRGCRRTHLRHRRGHHDRRRRRVARRHQADGVPLFPDCRRPDARGRNRFGGWLSRSTLPARERHSRSRGGPDRGRPVHLDAVVRIPHLAILLAAPNPAAQPGEVASLLAQDVGMRMIRRFDVDWPRYGYDDAALRDLVEFALRTMLSSSSRPTIRPVRLPNCGAS